MKNNERFEAQQWWKSTTKNEAKCDHCSRPLKRDDGYILRDIVINVGPLKTVYGELLVCESCFGTLRFNPRDSSKRGPTFHI